MPTNENLVMNDDVGHGIITSPGHQLRNRRKDQHRSYKKLYDWSELVLRPPISAPDSTRFVSIIREIRRHIAIISRKNKHSMVNLRELGKPSPRERKNMNDGMTEYSEAEILAEDLLTTNERRRSMIVT
jgi:hypothetical protein